jgi:AraC-like DNA-binding protein
MLNAAAFHRVNPAFLDFILRHAQVKTNVCSRQHSEQGYVLEPRIVTDHNLIFVTRGRVTWVLEQQPIPLQPGDLLFVPPGIRHHARSQTRRITLSSIHVELTLPGGQNGFDLLLPPPCRAVRAGCRLDCYLRAASDEWDRRDHALTMLMLGHWSRLIVAELLLYDAERGALGQRPLDPLVSQLLDELNQRLNRPTELAELAIWSGYSPQHLNRVFRRELGVTPLQYLARMRLERSAALLAEGRLTIRAVAARMGFEDPYYFSRLFKQHFGLSPDAYRRTVGAEPAGGSDSPSPGSTGPFHRPPGD